MKKKAQPQELGDKTFLLEGTPSKDIQKEHPLVGKTVAVSDIANESLKPFRGKKAIVTGVLMKGGQIAAIEVQIDGKTLIGPRKSFFTYRSYLEDIYLNGFYGQAVRQALSHWNGQHDYYGPSWDGVEAFHFQLAKVATKAAIEVAGWYKYPSSVRSDMDGKDWRLVVHSGVETVAVNCHSLLHDSVWTLNTTVYSTREIELSQLNFIGDEDHWSRTLQWTIEVARGLEQDGHDFSSVIEALEKRLRANQALTRIKDRMLGEVVGSYEDLYGPIGTMYPLSVGFSNLRATGPSIGCHDKPSDIQPYSIISIKPHAAKDPKYVRDVLKHELVHYVLQHHDFENEPSHGKHFQELAKELGLPEKYRD